MQSEYLRATSKDDSGSAGQRSDKSEVNKLISEKARLQDALETAQVNRDYFHILNKADGLLAMRFSYWSSTMCGRVMT
jgi:hypothetical protein